MSAYGNLQTLSFKQRKLLVKGTFTKNESFSRCIIRVDIVAINATDVFYLKGFDIFTRNSPEKSKETRIWARSEDIQQLHHESVKRILLHDKALFRPCGAHQVQANCIY